MCENAKILVFLWGVEIFNWVFHRHDLTKYRYSCAHWKGYSVNFSMNTRTSTFCQILREKNLIKDFNPLKKEEKYFCIFTHLYSVLPRLY